MDMKVMSLLEQACSVAGDKEKQAREMTRICEAVVAEPNFEEKAKIMADAARQFRSEKGPKENFNGLFELALEGATGPSEAFQAAACMVFAVQAIAYCAPFSSQALSVVKDLTSSPHPDVQLAALEAMSRFAPSLKTSKRYRGMMSDVYNFLCQQQAGLSNKEGVTLEHKKALAKAIKSFASLSSQPFQAPEAERKEKPNKISGPSSPKGGVPGGVCILKMLA